MQVYIKVDSRYYDLNSIIVLTMYIFANPYCMCTICIIKEYSKQVCITFLLVDYRS